MLLLALQAACGDGKSKISLDVVEKAGESGVVGDGTSDHPDAYLTPTGVKIAFKSFSLIKKDEKAAVGTPAPTPTGADYQLFNASLSNPEVIDLTSAPQQIAEKSGLPPEGTYDKAEYEVVYYEMVVQLCTAGSAPKCEPRKVHLSLADRAGPGGLSVKKGDVLIASADGKWGWVDLEKGLPEIVFTRPSEPVQIPDDKLDEKNAMLFETTLATPLGVGSDDDEKEVRLTLAFQTEKLFFFDDADKDTGRFNALASVLESLDGKGKNGCPSPCQKVADFWPGFPKTSLTSASN